MTAPPTTGITFLRSTTTTTVDREADGDVEIRVRHVARFAVRDGAVPDLQATRTQKFEPNWLEITWEDGELLRAYTSGPQRLKAGGTSEKSTLSKHWGRFSYRPLDRSELPEAIAAAAADYERHVAVASARPAQGGEK